MHVFWFTVGDFSLRAYGTIIFLAFILSLGVALFLARSAGRKDLTGHIVDMSLFAIFGGLIGARLWHVFVFHWEDYSQGSFLEIFKVWNGGLAIQGGLLGGLAVALFYCYRKKLDFWVIADICAPAMILGQGIGRAANLMNGDGLGKPTGADFGVLYQQGTHASDTYPGQLLWPAETWEGQIDVVILAVLLILRLRRWPSGYLFLFYAVMYSMNRFCMEFLRDDTSGGVFGLSVPQWTAVAIAVAAVAVLVLRRKKPLGLGFAEQEDVGSEAGNDEEPENEEQSNEEQSNEGSAVEVDQKDEDTDEDTIDGNHEGDAASDVHDD